MITTRFEHDVIGIMDLTINFSNRYKTVYVNWYLKEIWHGITVWVKLVSDKADTFVEYNWIYGSET